LGLCKFNANILVTQFNSGRRLDGEKARLYDILLRICKGDNARLAHVMNNHFEI
jgi:hypothetical protein